MTYFLIISIVLCVGGGIGLGFWIAAERKKRYEAELSLATMAAELEKTSTLASELERVLGERDGEIVRLNQVIADKNSYLVKLLASLEGNVSKEALDLLLEEASKDEVVG